MLFELILISFAYELALKAKPAAMMGQNQNFTDFHEVVSFFNIGSVYRLLRIRPYDGLCKPQGEIYGTWQFDRRHLHTDVGLSE